MNEQNTTNDNLKMESLMRNGISEVHVANQDSGLLVKGDASMAEDFDSQSAKAVALVGVNGNEAIDPNIGLVSFLMDKVSYKQHYLFSYREVVKHGVKIVFLVGNREIYASQMNKLYNQVNSSPDKKFSNPVIVVPLETALKNGLKAVDISGSEITLETPHLYLYLAVLDGQHRLMVALEHTDVDLSLELIDYDGDLMSFIEILNSMDKNWNNEDRKKSNLETGKSTNKLYTESSKMQREFGVSPKYADYLLTFKRDATKKADLIAGKDSTPFSEENAGRGYQLYKAIAYKFNDDKNIKKVEFIDAIVYVHNQNGDSNNQTFTRDMKCFITMMSDLVKNDILSLLKEKNYGSLKTSLLSYFQKFHSKYKDDLEHIEKEQDQKISELDVEKTMNPTKSDKIKAIKKGAPNEIFENRKNICLYNRSKKNETNRE